MLSGAWTGRRVGDYEIRERIGRGASAAVYRARQISVNRFVALKIIEFTDDDPASALRRFEEEAHVIAALENLHTVPIFDYGVFENQYAYFATRLMHRSLADELHNGALPLNRATRIIAQIANALQHAHEQGVIHRDIKPSNILLDDMGNAFLSDFGLAFRLNPAGTNGAAAVGLIGTPSYIAPELLQGKPADPRSDVYSFGVMIYHMLTGRVPFEVSSGLNIASIFYKHAQETPQPPSELNPALPAAVETVILRALAKDPHDRYPTVEALARDLLGTVAEHRNQDTALDAEISSTRTTVRRPAALRRGARSHSSGRGRIIAGVVGGLLLATLGIGIFLTLMRDPSADLITTTVQSPSGVITLTAGELEQARSALGADGFIAYVTCDSDAQVAEIAAIATEAEHLGVPLQVFDSEGDAYLQITQVDLARMQGARAVILCPLGGDVVQSTADSLAERAMPLVLTSPIDHPYGIKLDFNNYGIGLQVGRYAGRVLQTEHGGTGNVVLLGFAGLPASDERVRGMRAGLAQVAPDATILGEWRGLSRSAAYHSLKELIDQAVPFDTVLSIDANTTLGAVDALTEAGIGTNAVFIVSGTGNDRVLNYVEAGYYVRAALTVNVEDAARLMLCAALKLLAGRSLPETLTYESGELLTHEVSGHALALMAHP